MKTKPVENGMKADAETYNRHWTNPINENALDIEMLKLRSRLILTFTLINFLAVVALAAKVWVG